MVETLLSRLFSFMGANTLSLPVDLPKSMKVALVKETPSTIVSVRKEIQVHFLNAMLNYRKKIKTRGRQFARCQHVATIDKKN